MPANVHHHGHSGSRPTAQRQLFSTGRRCHWARAEKDAARGRGRNGVGLAFTGGAARLEIVDGDSNGSFMAGRWRLQTRGNPDHDLATVAKRQQAAAVHDRLVETLEAGLLQESPGTDRGPSLVAQAILANGNAQQLATAAGRRGLAPLPWPSPPTVRIFGR